MADFRPRIGESIRPQGTASNHISLSLTPRYAQNWGSWEGVRELVQNWHDGIYDAAQTLRQKGMPGIDIASRLNFQQKTPGLHYEAMLCPDSPHTAAIKLGEIQYDELTCKLTMINRHTSLHKRILLLGYSQKAAKREVIGQFGEGLKIGTLALVREGRTVTMETGRDHWLFELIKDPNFDEKVLTVLVTDRPSASFTGIKDPRDSDTLLNDEDTQTTVSIEPHLWKSYRGRFLFLSPPQDFVRTEGGTLLLDKGHEGQMYVKGVWVADMSGEDLKAGVDFTALQLDRDRNAVPKPSEIDQLISCIWVKALAARPELAKKYYNMLSGCAPYRDIRHVLNYADDTLAKMVADQFTLEHGSNAFAVGQDATSQQIEAVSRDLHRNVVICNMTLLRLLHTSGSQQPLDQALSQLKAGRRGRRHVGTLSVSERAALVAAVSLVQHAAPSLSLSTIDVRTATSMEVCTLEGGRLQVPDCWLRKAAVHQAHRICLPASSQCFCREVWLCSMLLDLHKKDKGALTTPNQPLLSVLHALLAKENSGRLASSSETNFISPAEVHFASNSLQELSVQREKELFLQIDTLKESHNEAMKTQEKEMEQLLKKFKSLEKEVITNEMKLVNEEARMKAQFEQQLKAASKSTEKELEKLAQENTTLKGKLHHLEKLLRSEEVWERREDALTDELLFYMEQCLHKSKTLAKLSEEKGVEEGGARLDGDRQQQLKEMLDMITENLQRERFVCAVCRRRRKEVVLSPCQHYQLCAPCAEQIRASCYPWCPTCKTPIRRCSRVFE